MATQEIDLNKLSEKLETQLTKMLKAKFKPNEIVYLHNYVDVQEIFEDAFYNVLNDVRDSIEK